MDKEAEVIQWARKMGYNGKIPPNMKQYDFYRICFNFLMEILG